MVCSTVLACTPRGGNGGQVLGGGNRAVWEAQPRQTAFHTDREHCRTVGCKKNHYCTQRWNDPKKMSKEHLGLGLTLGLIFTAGFLDSLISEHFECQIAGLACNLLATI